MTVRLVRVYYVECQVRGCEECGEDVVAVSEADARERAAAGNLWPGWTRDGRRDLCPTHSPQEPTP
jgi:hypothetical protein